MQIVVPRTCSDSCTRLLKREACQVGPSALARATGRSTVLIGKAYCLVMVRGCTALEPVRR
ncbi:hypothetical protein C1X65_23945 [Pseudomonas sp. FW305-70]|nr:hypothetical protein C1X65_23945 [Pseudomonas sp. FW305-70]